MNLEKRKKYRPSHRHMYRKLIQVLQCAEKKKGKVRREKLFLKYFCLTVAKIEINAKGGDVKDSTGNYANNDEIGN